MSPSILLFDDLLEERQKIATLLRNKRLNAKVEQFDGSVALANDESFETAIQRWIADTSKKDLPSLIACDKELGKYDNYRGLSATPVSEVALRLGVPFCQYSRQSGKKGRELSIYQQLRTWSTSEITLGGTAVEDWANQIAEIYKGYREISDWYSNLLSQKKVLAPPAALAAITSAPELESQFALYGSGEQSFLSETLSFVSSGSKKIGKDLIQTRMPRLLGNWMLLSVLRFPGILLNATAAASYLNIEVERFRKDAKIQNLFSSAYYTGPFSGLDQWWWRHKLDVLTARQVVGMAMNLLKPTSCDQRNAWTLKPRSGLVIIA